MEQTKNWHIHSIYQRCTGYQQLHKTQNPKQREKYHHLAADQRGNSTADTFTATLPVSEQQRWLEWGGVWMARNFHRSSSAVEGRNGYLSQMYHNGRGLTEKRLRALPPAAKPTAPARPAPPPPKPPVLMQIPLDNELTKRYRENFGAAILDAVEDRKQPYLVIEATHLAE